MSLRRHTHRSLLTLAVAALGLGLLAGPAAADPETPETREQSARLGDGSSVVAPDDVEDESDGLIAPGPDAVPYVPFYSDKKYQRLAANAEDSAGGLTKVASLPRPTGQATMSNLAFKGDYAFQGSYNGLTSYDISDPEEPVVAANVLCPGFQGDVSIAGDLLFFSVDQPRSNNTCTSTAVSAATPTNWEGIRIFDISDPTTPVYVNSVKTRCGSHTQTLVDDGSESGTAIFYNGSYDTSTTAATCRNPHEQIEIVEVELDDAQDVTVKEVKLWDAENPAFTAANRVNGGAATSVTAGCHDLTAYPSKDLLAAACMGDGLILDTSDPLNPTVTERVRDENYAFWHTAQFNNDASKVVFQDELGGGSSATCIPNVPQYRGANAIYALEDDQLALSSYYKQPRRQSTTENCVGHEGNLLAVDGKDVMVQAWYQGGASLIDFSNGAKAKEIGFFDRGPISDASLVLGGYWAVYVYNGYVYGSEIERGFDVLKLEGEQFADANRRRVDVLNPASQQEITYPYKTAPVVPSGSDLPVLTATPASYTEGEATEVSVSAPAGSFDDGEYVDIWTRGDDAEVLDTVQAAADGSATLTFTLPASQPVGTVNFIVRGDSNLDEELRTASVEVLEADPVASSTTLEASAASQVYGTSSPVSLTASVQVADESAPDGTVDFVTGSSRVALDVPVVDGKATATVSRTRAAGTYPITATFTPSSEDVTGSTSNAATVVVEKAPSKTTRRFTTRIKTTQNPKVDVTVAVDGVVPTNKVEVKIGSNTQTLSLSNGARRFTFPKLKAGTYTVSVRYLGSNSILPSQAANAQLTVTK